MGEFGRALRELRLKRGMTQQQLADLLGTSKQVVSRYESGQNSPKVKTIQEYATKLGIPVERLLKTEDEIRAMITPEMLAQAGGDIEEAFEWAVMMGDIKVDPTSESKLNTDILEALHQNPKLGMLFERQRNLSADQIEQVLRFTNFVLSERERNNDE